MREPGLRGSGPALGGGPVWLRVASVRAQARDGAPDEHVHELGVEPVTAIYSRNEAGSAGRTVEVTSMTVEVAPDEIRNWQAAKAQ
jgi:hypothetical protein